MKLRRSLFVLLPLLTAAAWADFRLTVLHTNDLHAHTEAGKVGDHVLGGYARQASLIKRLRGETENPILLNAGDTFQGTLYFNAYLGLADLAFMNMVGYDAMCLGNHEFDRGPEVLGEFAMRAVFPLLCANMDFSGEPALAGKISPSTILNVGGERIGVVGAVTPTLPTISSPGDKAKMLDLTTSVQKAIDRFAADGIDKIVVLTHVGYEEEVELTKKLRGIDVLVGGHSHTLLGECQLSGIKGYAPYPTIVKNADGDTALVVQAWEWGKVVGRLVVDFDDQGRVKAWPIAGPVPVTQDITPDPVVASVMDAFAKPIESLKNQAIGEAAVDIVRYASGLDSPMADLIADSMLAATAQQGAVAAFMNRGGVRSDLNQGPLTYGQAIAAQPFNNTLVILEIGGAELLAALEHGVSEPDGKGGALLYPSQGVAYAVDLRKPVGQRVSEVVIAGEPLDLKKSYRVTFNSFTASGGDAHEVLKAFKGRRVETGLVDVDALIDFIKAHSPLPGSRGARVRLKS